MRLPQSPFAARDGKTGDIQEAKTRSLRRADRNLYVSGFVEGEVLALASDMSAVIAGKGYDGDGFRAQINGRGAKPVVRNKSNHVRTYRSNKKAYRGRNVIERCCWRLKDFRRITTRHDKLARNCLFAVRLAALVVYWLNQVWTLGLREGMEERGRCHDCAQHTGRHHWDRSWKW